MLSPKALPLPNLAEAHVERDPVALGSAFGVLL
jgi:hypothetical protein